MTFQEAAAPELSFGDVLAADFLTDAYLRVDSSPMRERTVTAGYVKKQFGLDSLTTYVPVNENVPLLKREPEKDFVLAHGVPIERAVCLSDDCEIDTRLDRRDKDSGYEPEPSGRLLFSPITPLKQDEQQTLTERNWGRMQLGDDSVIEIRRVFSLSAEDLLDIGSAGFERKTLDPEWRLKLATWWAAYSCRRGPLVDVENIGKLAEVLQAHEVDPQVVDPLVEALTRTAAVAWNLGGASIETAGEERDSHKDDLSKADLTGIIGAIGNELEALEEAVSAARVAIKPLS